LSLSVEEENMSDCRRYAELIHAYSDGELSRAEAVRLTRHLGACPRCREELARVEALRARLARARDEFPGPVPDFSARVMRRIGPEKPVYPLGSRVLDFFRLLARPGRPAVAALAAAGLVLVLTAALLLISKTPRHPVLARAPESRLIETDLINLPDFYLHQHRAQAGEWFSLPVQGAGFTLPAPAGSF